MKQLILMTLVLFSSLSFKAHAQKCMDRLQEFDAYDKFLNERHPYNLALILRANSRLIDLNSTLANIMGSMDSNAQINSVRTVSEQAQKNRNNIMDTFNITVPVKDNIASSSRSLSACLNAIERTDCLSFTNKAIGLQEKIIRDSLEFFVEAANQTSLNSAYLENTVGDIQSGIGYNPQNLSDALNAVRGIQDQLPVEMEKAERYKNEWKPAIEAAKNCLSN